jgi:hypothetical protein
VFAEGIDDLEALAEHVLDTFAVEVVVYRNENGLGDEMNAS